MSKERDLPCGWKWVNVSDVSQVFGGLTKSRKRDTYSLRAPYLRVANVYANELRLDEVYEIGVNDAELAAGLLEPGDLLVVEGNGSKDQLGRVARWRGEIAGCLHQNHLIRVRPAAPVPSSYLLYWLLSPDGRAQIEDVGSSTSGLHTLSLSKVSSLGVPLAPPAEATRIVAAIEERLPRIDAAVVALKRVQANLKRYRASVLKAACEGRLVPTEAELARREGREYESAEVLLDRACASSTRRSVHNENTDTDIPQGWAWTTLSAIAELKGGITKGQRRKNATATRPVPYLRVANVQRGYLDLSVLKEVEATEDEIQGLALRTGDVLFNEGGDRDKLGRGWIWSDEVPLCIHQNHVFRARLRTNDILPKFVSWYANSVGQEYFLKQGKQTTNLASINLTKLGAFPICVPPKAEQERIVNELEARISVLDDMERAVAAGLVRGNRLRQSILKRAFEGKLVPQDPSDEPAGVLLERIRAERAAAGGAGKRRGRRVKAATE